jgi:hypothetical protein
MPHLILIIPVPHSGALLTPVRMHEGICLGGYDMKKNTLYKAVRRTAGMLALAAALALIPTGCNAETAVKDTVAGSTWSGMAYDSPATFTFAKEGGTFEAFIGDRYLEGGYKVVTGVEITWGEGETEQSNWGFIDEGTLSLFDTTFIKISGKEGIANTKWSNDDLEATIEFSKDAWVLSVGGDETNKGTYKVAPFTLLDSPNASSSLALIDGKLTFAWYNGSLTKETASASINGVYELVSGDSYAASIELKSEGICVIQYGPAFSVQGEYTVEGSDVVLNLQGMLFPFKKIGNMLYSEAISYEGVYQKQESALSISG